MENPWAVLQMMGDGKSCGSVVNCRCPQEDERGVCRLLSCKKNIDLVQEPDPSFDLRVIFLESSMRDSLKGKEWKEADVLG